MMGYASEYQIGISSHRRPQVLTTLQQEKQVVDGHLSCICDAHENVSCHHFLWMQGPGRHIRTLHGYWGFLWSHGWYSCPSSSRVLSTIKVLCCLRAGRTVHHSRHVCIPWCRCSLERYHAHHSLRRRDYV